MAKGRKKLAVWHIPAGPAVFDATAGEGRFIGRGEFPRGGGAVRTGFFSRGVADGAPDPLAGRRRADGGAFPVCAAAGGPGLLGRNHMAGPGRSFAAVRSGRGSAGRSSQSEKASAAEVKPALCWIAQKRRFFPNLPPAAACFRRRRGEGNGRQIWDEPGVAPPKCGQRRGEAAFLFVQI